MSALDKRARLLNAANTLVHRQGYNQTTLADIAKEAAVPLGNVYYYFKTKEDIGKALIEHRGAFYASLIAQWEQAPDPRQRLLALVAMVSEQRDLLASSGCPIGSLCQELHHKEGGPLAEKASSLLGAMLAWTEQQFRLLGKDDQAFDLALHLVSVLQGASLLTHTFNRPELITRETSRLTEWIESL